MKSCSNLLCLLVCAAALCRGQNQTSANHARFYKAEHLTAASYLELRPDGSYQITDREHMFVVTTEKGRWRQDGTIITFQPSTIMRGGSMVATEGTSYQGREVDYKRRTFIAFETDGASEIAVAVSEVQSDIDKDQNKIPSYVFFKVSAKVYRTETKQTHPFHYLKPLE